MFAIMRHRVAVATVLGCAATLLVPCSGVESSGDKDGDANTSTGTVSVGVDPAASKLTECVGAYNFIRTNDNGSVKTLATIQVVSSKGWMGLSDERGQFITLEEGRYTVQARGASGCSGIGGPAAEGSGVIGEVRVDSKQNADVWDMPSKVDEDSSTTVALADSNGDLASRAKTVTWTGPTEENDSQCEKIVV